MSPTQATHFPQQNTPVCTDWVIKYLGKEFRDKGRGPDFFDCYGLMWHVQVNVFGRKDVPPLDGDYKNINDKTIPCLCEREARLWDPIPLGDEKLGDVLLFRIRGEPWHIGTVLEKYKMLHIIKGVNVCVERYDKANWIRRIECIYRWRG